MPSDALVSVPGSGAAPLTYLIAAAQEIILKAAFANFDGRAAAASFLPCLRILSPSGHVVGEYVAQSSVAAGGSAEVSFAPFLGGAGGGSGGSGGPARVTVLETPDASGNAVPSLTTSNGFTNVKRLLPYLRSGADGYWSGSVRVPADYGSSPAIVVTTVINANSGVVRLIVGTAVVANGVSEDTAISDESAQNVTVPVTNRFRFDTTFSLTTTVVVGSDLNVRVKRNGANAADTCPFALGLWSVNFTYAVA